MTSTAILSPLARASVADTETGVPRLSSAPPEREPDPKGPSQTDASPKPAPNAVVRRTSIDWETGSVIYRVIDEHSGATLSQSPEEALLRLRAYARQSRATLPADTAPPTATEKTV